MGFLDHLLYVTGNTALQRTLLEKRNVKINLLESKECGGGVKQCNSCGEKMKNSPKRPVLKNPKVKRSLLPFFESKECGGGERQCCAQKTTNAEVNKLGE